MKHIVNQLSFLLCKYKLFYYYELLKLFLFFTITLMLSNMPIFRYILVQLNILFYNYVENKSSIYFKD